MATKVRFGVEGRIGEKDFSTYMIDDIGIKYGIHGYGTTAKEAIEDTYASYEEMKDLAAENNDVLPDMEFEFFFDIASLFNYYSYLNISAVAKKMGINASLMRKYASGVCNPSKERLANTELPKEYIVRTYDGKTILKLYDLKTLLGDAP